MEARKKICNYLIHINLKYPFKKYPLEANVDYFITILTFIKNLCLDFLSHLRNLRAANILSQQMSKWEKSHFSSSLYCVTSRE